jgi:hypothetical protein
MKRWKVLKICAESFWRSQRSALHWLHWGGLIALGFNPASKAKPMSPETTRVVIAKMTELNALFDPPPDPPKAA